MPLGGAGAKKHRIRYRNSRAFATGGLATSLRVTWLPILRQCAGEIIAACRSAPPCAPVSRPAASHKGFPDALCIVVKMKPLFNMKACFTL